MSSAQDQILPATPWSQPEFVPPHSLCFNICLCLPVALASAPPGRSCNAPAVITRKGWWALLVPTVGAEVPCNLLLVPQSS
jgi:hypothetical protein